MPENARLNNCLDEIDLAFVEREATPRLLMKLSIQLHLAGLSLSNTVSVLEVFGVERVRSTVHNWVHKADLQPENGRSPDHVAVDETVILLKDEQYWLYAAVDPKTNELLHTAFEPTTNKVIAHSFVAELNEKHDVEDAVFLIDGSHSLKDACSRHGHDFRYAKHGNRNSVEHVFREVKRRTSSFSNCFSNAEADTAFALAESVMKLCTMLHREVVTERSQARKPMYVGSRPTGAASARTRRTGRSPDTARRPSDSRLRQPPARPQDFGHWQGEYR